MQTPQSPAPRWGAVLALAFSVASIITAEFLPVSVLPLMARGLDVSEGLAGQSLTATAVSAIFASLLTGALARRVDRRRVLIGLTVAMVASNALVAFAPDFPTLIVARLLLGVSLGGFWAMAPALTMRLVPAADVPRALSIVMGGVSVSLVIAAPLGSLLGGVAGWRGVFGIAAAVSLACLAWQWRVLPPLPADAGSAAGGLRRVAARRGVPVAMIAIFCGFAGQFSFFSYMRPFYESITGLGLNALSAILLVFGGANFVATMLSSPLLRANLKAVLVGAPAAVGVCAVTLALCGHDPVVAFAVTAAWGFAFGFVPVAWSTWITRALPDDAESAGGLQVAVIQVANGLGAAVGGLALEGAGPAAPAWIAAALMVLTAIVASRVPSGSEDVAGEAVTRPATA